MSFRKEVFRVHCTRLQCLDGDRRGVVPKTLPDLAKLSVAKFSNKLEAAPLYLPLITSVMTQVGCCWFLHLGTGLPKIHTKTIRVSAVVVDQILENFEGGSSGDEEASLIQLSDSVMFDCVSISNTQ